MVLRFDDSEILHISQFLRLFKSIFGLFSLHRQSLSSPLSNSSLQTAYTRLQQVSPWWWQVVPPQMGSCLSSSFLLLQHRWCNGAFRASFCCVRLVHLIEQGGVSKQGPSLTKAPFCIAWELLWGGAPTGTAWSSHRPGDCFWVFLVVPSDFCRKR